MKSERRAARSPARMYAACKGWTQWQRLSLLSLFLSMWELRLKEAMPGATSVIYSLHSEYREEGKKKKKKDGKSLVQVSTVFFPRLRFTLLNTLRGSEVGILRFPVITQNKVSPSTEERTQRVSHTPRQTCKRGVYLWPSCLREQMHAHIKKHLDAINPFSGAEGERERSVSLRLLINKLLDNSQRVFTLLIYRRSTTQDIYDSFFWPQKRDDKALIHSNKQLKNAPLEANVI